MFCGCYQFDHWARPITKLYWVDLSSADMPGLGLVHLYKKKKNKKGL